MKTTIKCIVAAMLLTFVYIAQGQEASKRGTEERTKRDVQVLKSQLALTDEQTAQCEQIITKYADKLVVTRSAKSDSVQAGKTSQQLVQKRNDEITAVLTPAQKSSFEQWMQHRQHPHGKAMQRDTVARK